MKTKESGELQRIFSVLPEKAKNEAINYIEFLYQKYSKDKGNGGKNRALRIIDNYRGAVRKWTREELHER